MRRQGADAVLFLQAQQALPEQVNVGFAGIGTVPLVNICLASVIATLLGTRVPQ